MDIRKIVLYIALAVVVMSLWGDWQKDYGAIIPTTATVKQQAQTRTSTNDVPSIPATTIKKVTTAAAKPRANQGQLVHVKTDTLDLIIDSRGGNIINVKLPKYTISLKDKTPITLLNDSQEKQYIAQSGLLSKVGPATEKGQALYHIAKTNYIMTPDQKEMQVILTWQGQGVSVEKIFTFNRGSYAIDITYKMTNNSDKTWAGHMYGQIKRKEVTEKTSLFYLHTFVGASISTQTKAYNKLSYKDLREENVNISSVGGWLAFQQRYFLSTWVPKQNETNHYYSNINNGVYTLGYIGPEVSVAPGASAETGAKFYVGPEIADNLNVLAPHLGLTVDYGWLWIISVAIFWVMKYIYNIIGNWGWAIVITTLLIKLIFYKFSEKSYRSMAKMRKLMPRMKVIKERYGDDKQKMSQATMELYKKEKINPVSGCLPMIIQIPFFIALYWVLIESVELRHTPFIFWIHDLSAKDPFYILPILMGISMFIQQKLNPPPPDPTQAKMMMLLPVVFTAMFLNFPAGLVLYWLVNNIASGLQQWFIMYRVEKEGKKSKSSKRAKG